MKNIRDLRLEGLFLFLFIFCTSVVASAKPQPLNSVLLGRQVMCICQDQMGYIWIGTKQGLYKYNGSAFLEFSAGTDSISLNSYYINDLVVDKDNAIWMTNECGVASWDGNKFNYSDNSAYNMFKQVEILDDSNLLVNTFRSLRIIDKKTLKSVSENEQSELNNSTFYLNPKYDNIIVLQNSMNKIMLLNKNLFVERYFELPFVANKLIVDDHMNCLWVIGSHAITCLDLATFEPLPIPTELVDFVQRRNLFLFSIYGKNGYLMGADGECMYVYDRSTSSVKPFYESISLNKIDNGICFVDKDLNVWLSDGANGITMYPHYQLAYNILDHLKDIFRVQVFELFSDMQGYLWFLNAESVASFDPRSKRILKKYNNHYRWIYFDTKGKLILQDSDKATISICDVRNGEIVGEKKVALPINPTTMSFTQQGEIWMSDYNQVGYLDKAMNFHYVDSPCDNASHLQIVYTKLGKHIFLSTASDGVFIWNNSNRKFERFETGVSNIDCISESEDGKVWIGSFNEGLSCHDIKADKLRKWDMSNGFPGNHIKTIEIDSNQNLWMSTPESIFRFNPESGEIVYIQDIEQGLHPQYVRSELDKTGILYYTNGNGLTCIDSHNPYLDVVSKPEEIPLELDALSVNGKELSLNQSLNKGLSLKYNENVLNFSFSGIKFEYGAYLKYSYMMEGLEDDWHFSDSGQNIMYSNLPSGSYVFRARVKNKNGQWSASEIIIPIEISPAIWFTWWAKVLYFLSIVSLIGLAIWIYVRHKINQDHMKLMQREREMAEEHLQFVANLSHELHTPLTLIQAPLIQLQNSDSLNEANQSLVDLALRSAGKLRYLSDKILETGKMDHSKESKLKVNLGNISTVVHSMVDNFRFIANERDIKLNLTIDSKVNLGYFDLDKVEKILSNLLSNAIKYTNQVNGEIIVQVGLRENKETNQEFVSVSVLDNGLGIAPDKQNQLFNRFNRLEAEDNYPSVKGSGIGLNYSQFLAQVHHGSITYIPRTSGGSVFCLEIPYNKDSYSVDEMENDGMQDTPLTPIEFATQRVGTTGDSEKKGQILIVEDDRDVRVYLQNLFLPDYDVSTAIDGRDALERLDAGGAPDLILSDIVMPRMDGYQLCSAIRDRNDLNFIPVVLLTAQNSIDSHLQGLDCGADAYIPKPFNPFVLQKQVESLLRKRMHIQQRLSMLTSTSLKELETSKSAQSKEETLLNEYDRNFLEKLYTFMDEHLKDSSYSSSLLAQDMCMSLSSFSIRIKRLLGTTPHNLMNSYKMNKALELLRTGMPIGDVCYEIGASAVSNFNRMFKQKFGVTPGNYQEIEDFS